MIINVKSKKERDDEIYRSFIKTVKSGKGVSAIVGLLALNPELYKGKFPLEWNRVQTTELIEYFCQAKGIDKTSPPEFVEVPFAYYLLKYNLKTFLARLVHDAKNREKDYKMPRITTPYRIVSGVEEDTGRPTGFVKYLPKYDGTPESAKEEETLDVKFSSMEFFFYQNLPEYINLISREMIIEQLRPYYLKDQIVNDFIGYLKEHRHIDLMNGYIKMEEEKPLEDTDLQQELYGHGVTLTDTEAFARMMEERERFTQNNPHLLVAGGNEK